MSSFLKPFDTRVELRLGAIARVGLRQYGVILNYFMNVGKCCEQQLMAVKLLCTPVCASEADARGEHDAMNRSCEGLFMFESDRGSSLRFTHIAFITVPAAPVIL